MELRRPVTAESGASDLDLSYRKAVQNKSIPFELWNRDGGVASPPKLDAIYIPTRAHRPPPSTPIRVLRTHARHIYLLYTAQSARWVASREDPSLVVEEHVPTRANLAAYYAHTTSSNPSAALMPTYDIPAKRTYALAHARERGLTRVGLLDDDILLRSTDLLRVRRALLSDVTVGSFHVLDYPDVSTVDHIERIIERKPSRVSLGGNCLFFRTDTPIGFFPRLYNDDWLVIFRHMRDGRIASFGTARQRPYRAWLNPLRIAFEQFGDVLVAGLKAAIVGQYSTFPTDPDFWGHALARYRRRLERLRTQNTFSLFDDRLGAALAVVDELRPSHLGSFLRDYLRDEL